MKSEFQIFFFFVFILLQSTINLINPKFFDSCGVPEKVKDKETKMLDMFDKDNKIPFKVTKEVFDELVALSNKFKNFRVVDLSKKEKVVKNVIKKKAFDSKKPSLIKKKCLKPVTQIFIDDEQEYFKSTDYKKELNEDMKNSQSRLKELNFLKKMFNSTNMNYKASNKSICSQHNIKRYRKKFSQHQYLLKIRLNTIKEFFEWLIKGFKKIKGKNDNILYQNNTYTLSENIITSFTCNYPGDFSISYDIIDELKMNIENINYTKYKESMLSVINVLRRLAMKVNTYCRGIDYFIDVIEKYITHIKDDSIKPDYLINIEYMKNRAFTEIDKNSFNEAGYTLGKIIGESRKYSYYFSCMA